MRYVIWGAGTKGVRLVFHIGLENVVAFLDSDVEKIGESCCEKEIVNFEQYKQRYKNFPIIIAFQKDKEAIEILKKHNISNYLFLTDCPGEFQESNVRNILKKYIINDLDKRLLYGVQGITLYSILVYDWIYAHCDIKPWLIVNEKISSLLYKGLLEEKYQVIYEEESGSIDFDKIFICEFLEDSEREKIESNRKLKYIYDCSAKIPEYYNKKIEKFKNLHKGQRCFIVATGPSLKKTDLEILRTHQELSIGMNSLWKGFDDILWRPDYYVADDYRAVEEIADILDLLKVKYFFIGDTSENFMKKKHGENVLIHHFNAEYAERRAPRFSEDFARQCYLGATVTYSCMQLAVYMGFTEIYLLGVDYTYGNSKDNEKYEHFYKEKELEATAYPSAVEIAYKTARKYADKHGIRIYNATRGGKLEIFDRVDFDTLF